MPLKSLLQNSVNLIPYSLRRYVHCVPFVAAAQRYLVSSLLSDSEFVHCVNAGPAAGLKFQIRLPGDKAVWAGTYEKEFSEAIAAGVPAGAVCFDVGGYRGYMSGVMALHGADKVYVFEPLPANQQAIQRLCQLNQALQISLQPVAVGAEDTDMQMKVMPDASMGKLADSDFQRDIPAESEMTVRVRSLDSMISSGAVQIPQLIKIDVEGAELQVLRGARNLLAEHRPLLFIEAHSAELECDCSAFLTDLAYSVRRMEAGELCETSPRHLLAQAVSNS